MPISADPVVPQLLFISAEHAEHRCSGALHDAPEAALGRVLSAHNPLLRLQRIEEAGHAVWFSQPLIDGAALQAAMVGMHELAEQALAFQRADQFLFKIEAGDKRGGRFTELVQPITLTNPLVVGPGVAFRQQLQQCLNRFVRVAGCSIVDGDVQLEVVAVDAQFCQFIGGDQQVQRRLLIAQVVANSLGLEGIAVRAQGQLNGTLQITLIDKWQQLQAAKAAEQALIDQYVVATRITVTQLF